MKQRKSASISAAIRFYKIGEINMPELPEVVCNLRQGEAPKAILHPTMSTLKIKE